MKNEIGRELKVSELVPLTVIVLMKDNSSMAATMWVVSIEDLFVMFAMGETRLVFCATRCGPDLEQLTDNTGVPMRAYEYLGVV